MAKKRRAKCHEVGCAETREGEFDFCTAHLAMSRRCRAVSRKTGEQCNRPAMKGLRVCNTHGGNLPASKAKSERAHATTEMQKFVDPYNGPMDVIDQFEQEFRRTIGRIRWYDEQLAKLANAEDLIYGLTKEEQVQAAEYPGTNTTYEARANMFYELQWKERKHFLEMQKLWISAKLDTEKLNLLQTYVEKTYTKMVSALERLGLDSGSDEVRGVLADVLLEGTDQDPRTRPEAIYGAPVRREVAEDEEEDPDDW